MSLIATFETFYFSLIYTFKRYMSLYYLFVFQNFQIWVGGWTAHVDNSCMKTNLFSVNFKLLQICGLQTFSNPRTSSFFKSADFKLLQIHGLQASSNVPPKLCIRDISPFIVRHQPNLRELE